MALCECGCGQEVKKGRRFIQWHNGRVQRKTEEQRRAISERMKGNKHGQGHTKSEESKKKAVETRRSNGGYVVTEEMKEALRQANTGRRMTDENKEALRERMKGNQYTKGRVKPPEEKKRHSEANKGRVNTPEQFALQQRRRDSPEVVAKQITNTPRRDKHWNWCGGIAIGEYCELWRDQAYKEEIRERDGNKCLSPFCKGNIDESKTKHVHHIDYDKQNCHPKNLITLCNSCHSTTSHVRRRGAMAIQLRAVLTEVHGYEYE